MVLTLDGAADAAGVTGAWFIQTEKLTCYRHVTAMPGKLDTGLCHAFLILICIVY